MYGTANTRNRINPHFDVIIAESDASVLRVHSHTEIRGAENYPFSALNDNKSNSFLNQQLAALDNLSLSLSEPNQYFNLRWIFSFDSRFCCGRFQNRHFITIDEMLSSSSWSWSQSQYCNGTLFTSNEKHMRVHARALTKSQ